MTTLQVYRRALDLLSSERVITIALVLAGMVIAIVQVYEQKLFGWVVDALAKGEGAFPIIGLWAMLGLGSILASVVVAVLADRLAHRRRLAAMGLAF